VHTTKLIGPFVQALPMTGLPARGPIADEQLPVFEHAGLLIHDGRVRELGSYDVLYETARAERAEIETLSEPAVLLPGLIDAHTHICATGSRAGDYALRIAGKSYQAIQAQGGGIYTSVESVRAATQAELAQATIERAGRHLQDGVTTIEVKSGYGLSVESELKMLRAIREADASTPAELIPTCLAAHLCPKEFPEAGAYLRYLELGLLPLLKDERLTDRIDIFVEPKAFPVDVAATYLANAQAEGFKLTVHADQFTPGGSELACRYQALSADHLEASGEQEIQMLAHSQTSAVALPGASMGLGMNWTPARRLLDAGSRLAIASDWNPGSAPMGDLLLQAAVLSAMQKLSTAETLAGITTRAAMALALNDYGELRPESWADAVAFPTRDYRDILYHQGRLKPAAVWKQGERVV
jgi:imidazolonepropionase